MVEMQMGQTFGKALYALKRRILFKQDILLRRRKNQQKRKLNKETKLNERR